MQYPMTMYFAPMEVLLNLEIEFTDHLTSDDVEKTIVRLEERIHKRLQYKTR